MLLSAPRKAEQAEKLASARLEQIKILGKVKRDEIKELTAKLEGAANAYELLLEKNASLNTQNARLKEALEKLVEDCEWYAVDTYDREPPHMLYGFKQAKLLIQQLSNQGDGNQ